MVVPVCYRVLVGRITVNVGSVTFFATDPKVNFVFSLIYDINISYTLSSF